MRVTMHQPEHLPWLGFFDKMAQADLYVVMDTFQYRHQYFQNRNRIMGVHDFIWVNVPVLKEQHRYGPLADIRIDNSRNWRKRYWGSVAYHYHRHPYFARYGPDLEALLTAPWHSLAELNLALIDFFRAALGITTPMVRCSSLRIQGRQSELIHRVALEVGASTYLSGPSGRDYLDESVFTRSGIAVCYHDYRPKSYPQRGKGGFHPYLSTLDLLMNCGPASLGYLLNAAKPAAPQLMLAS